MSHKKHFSLEVGRHERHDSGQRPLDLLVGQAQEEPPHFHHQLLPRRSSGPVKRNFGLNISDMEVELR